VGTSKYQMSMWDNQLSRPHAYLVSEAKRSLGSMIGIAASFPLSPLHEQLESRVTWVHLQRKMDQRMRQDSR
jgi:hypothetical protein